jgi:hypothetical protein
MAKLYPSAKLLGIELQRKVFRILEENVATFKYSRRVGLINGNCIPFLKRNIRVKPAFINFDPPWGGPDYARRRNIMLYLSNTNNTRIPLYDVFNNVFAQGVTNFITFKAPFNFDMRTFKARVRGAVMSYPIRDKPNGKKVIYQYVVIEKV